MRIKKGAKYKRVSSVKQVVNERKERREDGSLEMQDSRIESVLQYKSSFGTKYEIVADIEDAGKSAKDTNRPGFKRLLSLIKQKQIDFIIFTKIDRICRNTRDFLEFVKLCEENDVELIILNPDVDTASPVGKLLLTVLASLAEFEREQTSERLKDNLKERLLISGKINGAGELLGLDRDTKRKGHFVINNEEVKALEDILKIYLDCSSQKEALKVINEKGLKYKKDENLTRGKFELLLKNVEWRYAGKWYFDDKESGERDIVDLDHGPVLEESLRKAVIDKRVESRKKHIRKGKNNIVYLLTKVLVDKKGNTYCGEYARSGDNKYRYYRGKKSSPRVDADLLETTVENRIIEYFTQNHLFENLVLKRLLQTKGKIPQINAELRSLGRKLHDCKSKRSNLVSRLADFSRAMPKEAISAISNEIGELESEREGIEQKIESLNSFKSSYKDSVDTTDAKLAIKKYAEKFKSLSRVNKRKLIEEIFEKIEVLNQYSIKLHIKKAPKEGLFGPTVNVCSSSNINGGSCKT